ncbi:sulfotransferase domain-containing protein [Streptomyces diacarni]|nr:sulfotransferase domain-containing protein [Streptomyces diacarni]
MNMDQQSREKSDPVALHRQNAARLGPRDVVIAAYPGSGASLISNILIELGFDHVDPYSEVIAEDGRCDVLQEDLAYRSRLSAMAALDRKIRSTGTRPEGQLRFVKNHLHPRFFSPEGLAGAVLLVRDPRDTLHSCYHWYHSFSADRLAQAKGQGTFAEFLDGIALNGEPPVEGWCHFNRAWADALEGFPRSAVIRFEDLKTDPEATTARLVEAFGFERSPESIARATRNSRYENMRAHEEKSLGAGATDRPLVMRRGKVEEWREWWGNAGLAAPFHEPRLVETADRFGYQVTRSDDSTPGH